MSDRTMIWQVMFPAIFLQSPRDLISEICESAAWLDALAFSCVCVKLALWQNSST